MLPSYKLTSTPPRVKRDLPALTFWLLALVLLNACAAATPAPTRTPFAATTGQPVSAAPPAPEIATATPQSTLRPTMTSPPASTSTPLLPTATPHPLFPYTIAGLQQRDFPGGEIQIRSVVAQNDSFTQYAIDYPSDGLVITGLMYVPAGDGPFSTLILLHGYIDRERYFPGADTWQAAEFFAGHGFLVLAPDLRSWGGSDTGLSLFHTGFVADVLNLIGSLSSLPDADPDRIGLWGHSMGGGIATKVLTVDNRIRAAVLYAPNSADDADLISRWGPGCLLQQSQAAGDHCNPADIIPPDTPPALIDAYLAGAGDPLFMRQVAPIYHLQAITAPVQIHIGTADGQTLVETPTEWTAKLYDALQVAGRDVTYFAYEGQGHSFSGAAWTTLLDRALHFFNTHLRGDSTR